MFKNWICAHTYISSPIKLEGGEETSSYFKWIWDSTYGGIKIHILNLLPQPLSTKLNLFKNKNKTQKSLLCNMVGCWINSEGKMTITAICLILLQYQSKWIWALLVLLHWNIKSVWKIRNQTTAKHTLQCLSQKMLISWLASIHSWHTA